MNMQKLDKSKSFNHPTFGKIVGYNNLEEFNKAVKEWNQKEINKRNK